MAILDILTFPDPRLRQKARPVEQVDDQIRRLVDDMLETMYAAPGIGLAATQVDVQRQIIVIDVSEGHDTPLCFINPRLVAREGTEQMDEGCLSVPGFFETVTRAERVTVEALDRDGKPFKLDADGLLAVCIQHEMDHLDGKLFVDHISILKRQRIRHKLEKQRKERQHAEAARAREAAEPRRSAV
ncbi:peptide deformylase [Allochromatium vinosum]|uniref:Peptide deformylase n=1 Tax=Allochromatium vinosum (strain ATCC 17899 / DSM 180 / NBRC 103801 / NCIMB 10441 / D) TaxID=572477 RepID=D3RV63_ALLVD|nr:peptide deformylase [Allochromatium vinosum]ADC62995.1 peptide deformylase [Allochromatium vinosum DSM 180]